MGRKRLSPNKELNDLIVLAEGNGWQVVKAKSGHLHFTPPEGRTYVTGSTPSDHRAILNFRAKLRRAGLDC